MGKPMIYRVTQTRQLLWFSPDGEPPDDYNATCAFEDDGEDPKFTSAPEPASDLYRDNDLVHHLGREEITAGEARRRVAEASVEP